ncbi:MAG: EAL domain-containing protein, partial [Alphaproteobacteria bacterium]|nr:EAL domain-containing protein [Alphaproteobacteria bacterium]
MSDDIKIQRDRFLAFAFASADLFIEVSIEGKVCFALGATKSLTGKDEKGIMGRSWLELFAVHEQARMQSFYENCKTGKRAGPVLVNLNEMVGDRQAILTAFKLPGNRNFFITFATGNALMSKIARMTIDAREAKPLNAEEFSQAAQEQIRQARAIGQNVGMTLFDFTPSADQKTKMGTEAWEKLQSSVGELLAGHAFDGQTSGQVAEGRITLIHEKDLSADDLRAQIQSMAKKIDPAGEGYDIKTKTVDVNTKGMSDRDASRALLYTLHEFERQGTEITIQSLQESLETQIAANAQKIKELQTIIERAQFSLHFQPIIDLKTKEATHYEMLCRFESGNTADWITFCEDVGLAPQFDLAVCDRAIQYI